MLVAHSAGLRECFWGHRDRTYGPQHRGHDSLVHRRERRFGRRLISNRANGCKPANTATREQPCPGRRLLGPHTAPTPRRTPTVASASHQPSRPGALCFLVGEGKLQFSLQPSGNASTLHIPCRKNPPSQSHSDAFGCRTHRSTGQQLMGRPGGGSSRSRNLAPPPDPGHAGD